MRTYRLADSVPFGSKLTYAIATGEFRPPRKGEWYISGAIPSAYRAPNDLSTKYHIAQVL